MTTVLKHCWVSISIAAAASVCVADTWTVDWGGKADFSNIQEAIDAASDGDEIIVMPGIYVSKQALRLFGKEVWLHSINGPEGTIVESQGGSGFICVDGESPNTHIQGFTIRNCDASPYDWDGDGTIESWERSGGGMGCGSSNPSVSDCRFLNNHASSGGGGMFNYNSNPTLTECIFESNTVGDDASGAGMYNRNNSSPQLTNCSFLTNHASVGGGMYNYNSSSPSLSLCIFSSNSAALFGGGMYNRYFSNPTLLGCDFLENSATSGGGGMYNSSLSDPSLTDCSFIGNHLKGQAAEGGGMGNLTSSPTLINCTFADNDPNGGVGGGVSFRVGCDPTITGCSVTGNVGGDAGGGGMQFYYFCNPTLSDCLISGNSSMAGGAGGGLLFSTFCNATLTNCTIDSNDADRFGGGIACKIECELVITDCTVTNNTTDEGFLADLYVDYNSCLVNVGSNTVGEMILQNGSALTLQPETQLHSLEILEQDNSIATIIEIDDLNTNAAILADSEFVLGGSLSIANSSGSLSGAELDDIIPLIQAGTLIHEFASVMFPTMPAGLGLQLVESSSASGPSTLVSMQVIAVEGAEFEGPLNGTLPGPPVDVQSLDIDNDGKDEIAYLLDGSPGSIVVYSVTGDGNAPVLIQGLQVNVGNNPVDLDVADLNGDGNDDLLVANASGTTLNVLLVDDGRSTEHSFNVLTIAISSNGPSLLTCAAIIDWDGDSDLDAVVGVDVIDESIEDRYEVVLDIATNSPTSGPSFNVPMYQIGSVDVADTPTCVAGAHGTNGVNVIAWGFVGGTSYGHLHRTDPSSTRATLEEMASLEGNKVTSIEVRDLDANGGDGLVDILASSGDAKSGYLLQGEVGRATGFGELIPLNVGDMITDIIAIDADRDGDMDFLIATPESATSLQLLRNDGSSSAGARMATLDGNSFNRQDVNTANPVTKITSGGLTGKDDEDDWTGGGNQNSGPLLNGTLGSMDQVNIIPPDPPACVGDFNEDNVVDISDLLSLIAAWGSCNSCSEDLNTDGVVDVSDLLTVIAAWGDC